MGRYGANLVVADINHEGAEEVAQSIVAAGGTARAARLDVTRQRDVQDLINEMAREHGRLDLIFNNAGIGILGDERDKTVDHWNKIIDVNLHGVLYGTTAAYPLMVEQGNIPLRIESYETFQMVARAAIKHLDIKRSKDPNAGRPIIGSAAAKRLDPTRNREALKQAKQEARREERQAEKLEQAKRRKDGDVSTASTDPDAAAEPSGRGST